MVVFTCSHCGESLQKPRVEKHYNTVCRNPISVSCMDCFKDFRGEEYVQHTKCISEQERYSAKGFQAKPSANKGLIKQQKWIESIQTILADNPKLPAIQRDMLNTLSRHDNVPRKLNKFMNFMTSINRRFQVRDLTNIFELLEQEHKKNVVLQQQNGNSDLPQQNGNSNNENGTCKEILNGNGNLEKPKLANGTNVTVDKFKWKPTILHFVNKKRKISSKKLMTKVLQAYKAYNPDLSEVSDDIVKKYHTKLGKMKKVIVESDVVKLKQ